MCQLDGVFGGGVMLCLLLLDQSWCDSDPAVARWYGTSLSSGISSYAASEVWVVGQVVMVATTSTTSMRTLVKTLAIDLTRI